MTGVGPSACRGRWTTWGPCSDPASLFSSLRGAGSPTDPSSSSRRSRARARAVDAGVPAAWGPLLWGAFHVVKSSLSTYAGILSDRWSRKHLIVAGWIGFAACHAAWGVGGGAAGVGGVVPVR